MTTLGTVSVCDSCGRDIGNAGIDKAVVVATVTDAGEPLTLHLCRQPLPAPNVPCAAWVLNGEVLHAYVQLVGALPTIGETQ